MEIHHVGYLVKNILKAMNSFTVLGFEVISDQTRDEYRGVDIVFMQNGGYVIELVSPYRDDSVVSAMIKRIGNTPYHICYAVDDIEQSAAFLRTKGYASIDPPTAAPAIDSRRVCFLAHPKIGLIELVEREASAE